MKLDVPATPIVVPGFRFAGVAAGIKESGRPDVALLVADRPATAAAAFTTNRVQAAPVQVGLPRAASGRLQAIVVNSGNANAFTGAAGVAVAEEMCRATARLLRIDPTLVLPSSTGRIGVALPRPKVLAGIKEAFRLLRPDGFHDALAGIMTTDAFPKFAVEHLTVDGHPVTIAGMTKGAGMIAPRLRLVPHATNLTYVLTDAAVALPALRQALALALPETLNAVVVDGDTSTNDTAVLLAGGAAGNRPLRRSSPDFGAFSAAVKRVLASLARMIVLDGEGATHAVTIRVEGARNRREAERAADAIARSPLCKTAFFGGDPYMGRVVCALGNSGAQFDPERLEIDVGDVPLVRGGRELVGKVEKRASAVVAQTEFCLTIRLQEGSASALRLASDLTVDYVRFNSDYRT